MNIKIPPAEELRKEPANLDDFRKCVHPHGFVIYYIPKSKA